MDLLTGGLSLIGGLSGLFGNQSNPALNLPTFNPGPSQGQLNTDIPNLTNFNLGGQNLGQYGSLLQSAVDNPYGAFPQDTAALFSGSGFNPAITALGNAGNLAGTVPGLTGAAGSILNTGFDPQNALYNRTLQQTTDQTNAALASMGLGTTPWGAGVLGQTLGDFNINWQNAQLGRQTQAASGAEGLIGQAGSTAEGALGLAGQAPGVAMSSAFLPYSTYNTLAGTPLSLLQQGAQYGNTSGQLPQSQIGDWLTYMNAGNQQNQLALQSQNQQFNQNQRFGTQIGSGLSQLGAGFGIPSTWGGAGTSFGGGNNFASTSSPYSYGAGGYTGQGPFMPQG